MNSDRLAQIDQGVLSFHNDASPTEYKRNVGGMRVDMSIIDSDARRAHAAQLSKDILKLHSDMSCIGNSTLPTGLISLAISSTNIASVHKAIADFVRGFEDAANMILATRELNLHPDVLKTRIMHYVMNIVPNACLAYTHAIKDNHKTMIFACDPYIIGTRGGSPTGIMEEAWISGGYTNLCDVNESAVRLLEMSKMRAD